MCYREIQFSQRKKNTQIFTFFRFHANSHHRSDENWIAYGCRPLFIRDFKLMFLQALRWIRNSYTRHPSIRAVEKQNEDGTTHRIQLEHLFLPLHSIMTFSKFIRMNTNQTSNVLDTIQNAHYDHSDMIIGWFSCFGIIFT